MADPLDTFRTLHRILKQKTDLESRLKRGPQQVSASQNRVNHCQDELSEAKKKVQAARMAADEKQLQLKSREARVEDLNGRLNTAATNKEYQAIKEQIAADEQANAVLADETFEMLEKIDELNDAVSQVEASLKTCQDEFADVSSRVEELQKKLESELERVLEEMKLTENELPGDVKSDYLRMVKTRGESSFAEVENGTCGNCYQTLTPQLLDQLTMKKTVFCSGCGSVLYTPERV